MGNPTRVRFIGQFGKSYLNKSLTVNQNTNWGLVKDKIYEVSEVIEDPVTGKFIYALKTVSNLYDASCFMPVE